MEPNLKDILTHLKTTPDQEALLRYLQNNLSNEDTHDLEAQINDDEFLEDALEGLDAVQKDRNIEEIIQELNLGLKKQILTKKKPRRLKGIPKQTWTIYAILCILLLCLMAYWVISKLL